MSDQAILQWIGDFIKNTRLRKNISQGKVAERAGLSRSTVSLLERGENTQIDSLIKVLRVLDVLDVLHVFSVKEEISPLAYAKLKRKKRKHASPKPENEANEEDLGW